MDDLTMEYDNDINKPTNDCSKVDENQDSVHSDLIDNDDKVQGAEKAITLSGTGTIKKEEARPKSIPPPGTGQRIYEIDPFLRGYREHLDYRWDSFLVAWFYKKYLKQRKFWVTKWMRTWKIVVKASPRRCEFIYFSQCWHSG